MTSLLLLVIVTALSGALLINYYFAPQRADAVRALKFGPARAPNSQGKFEPVEVQERKQDSEQRAVLAPESEEAFQEHHNPTMDERLFRAGFSTDNHKRAYRMARIALPLAGMVLGMIAGAQVNIPFIVLGAVLGLLVGMQLPISILERAIAKRDEEIMFFLPLVIEQIVLGVSSSLDVGPCVQRVVAMADERDSHNPVTELLSHVQQLVRSGLSFEEALKEIGRLAGHTELRHSFIALAQVAKHGGEISRQLQELADAVSSQRETKIEGRIKRLELEATGPVGLVFLGFMCILLIGLGLQVMKAFSY